MARRLWTLRHPLSLLGASLATVAGVLFIAVLAAELAGFVLNDYVAGLIFMLLPALLGAALVLIPVGGWLDRRHSARPYPRLDLNEPSHRRRMLFFSGLTAANVVILSTAGYRTIEHAESPAFCGQTCHTVMNPEYTAWQDSPHARVACVDCHTGPGATGFLRAKLNGVHQLVSVMKGKWPTPIPSPAKNMRPARETCERCHWPNLWQGERLRVTRSFASDEANTPVVSARLMKVGGGEIDRPNASGIHWHMNVANRVEYVPADPTRLTIPWVRFTGADGKSKEFLASGATRPTDEAIRDSGRTMDCLDCHNRPAHRFPGMERAVDDALLAGRLPIGLPWVRQATLTALQGEWSDAETAARAIEAALKEFYAKEHPDLAAARAAEIEASGREAVALYRRHVHPDMKVTWGAYPSFLGHEESPGCFRCHDGEHVDAEGVAINNDCEVCHTLLEDEQAAALAPLPSAP